jgi:hypothetical protein
MNTLPPSRLLQSPSTAASRLSVYSDSCFFPDGLFLPHFICKKIPFPCTILLLVAGLATGLSDPSIDLRFIFQQGCALGRAA